MAREQRKKPLNFDGSVDSVTLGLCVG